MAVKPTPQSAPQKATPKTAPSSPSSPSSPSPTEPPPPAPSPKPQAATAVAPAPIPPPVKIPLEASIKKTVSDRRNVLVINLRKENEDEVKREEEVRLGKERIALLETEMAEIDAFLARN